MADRAHVTSVEDLDRFRVAMLIFLEKAGQVLDETSDEVKRTRIWLQSEQGFELDRKRRRKMKDLELLEQEMFSARLSNLSQVKTGLQRRIQRKRREIRALEDKMRRVKEWLRNYDSRVEPIAKKVDKLRFILDSEMGNAVNFLVESIRSLEAYADAGKQSPAPSSTPSDAKPEPEEDGEPGDQS